MGFTNLVGERDRRTGVEDSIARQGDHVERKPKRRDELHLASVSVRVECQEFCLFP